MEWVREGGARERRAVEAWESGRGLRLTWAAFQLASDGACSVDGDSGGKWVREVADSGVEEGGAVDSEE